MPKPIPLDPELWELGCLNDVIRNDFVIPLLRNLIKRHDIRRIADVGCGTGYVSRSLLDEKSAESFSWLLLDQNPIMLEYARSRFVARDVTYAAQDLTSFVDGTFARRPQGFDLAFCAYTLLEVEDLDAFAMALKRVVPAGFITVFVPDAFGDILKHYLTTGSLPPNSTSRGGHVIDKVNGFTNSRQSFLARQAVEYVDVFVDRETQLVEMAAFTTRTGGRHFAMVFARTSKETGGKDER